MSAVRAEPSEGPQVHVHDGMAGHPDRSGHTPRRLQLHLVALAVTEADRVGHVAVGTHDGEDRR